MMDNKNRNTQSLPQKAEESVKAEDKSINDYLDVINRQLREPVTNIFASLPLLAESINSQNTEKSFETLNNVYQKSYRMLKCINNMSLAAKLMGNVEMAVEAVDMSSLIQSIFESAKQVLPDYFTLDLQVEKGCIVRGSKALMTTMLFNLLVNSFDYKVEDDVRVQVNLKYSNSKWTLTYRDNSIGIRPELMQHIYQPYFSCNPYNDGEPADKMGLGLYIVKQAVAHTGGTILLQSEFGSGVSYIISMPEYDIDSEPVVTSRTKDFMLNKYSDLFVTMCDYCTLPDLL